MIYCSFFNISAQTSQLQNTVKYSSRGGIFNFSGYPRETNNGIDNPSVSGVEIYLLWKEVEPEKGVFKWEILDREMKPWVDAGKRVAVRIVTASNDKNATPDWLLHENGVRFVDASEFSKSDIIYPVFWDEVVVQAYCRMIQSFADRYDGRPFIEFVQIGDVGRWEEMYVCSENKTMDQRWQELGYTHDLYIAHCKRMTDIFIGKFKKTPVLLSLSTGGPDPKTASRSRIGYELADYALKHGVLLKQNGMQANYSYTNHEHFSRIFTSQRGQSIRIYEPASTGNPSFASDFKNYVNRALLDCPNYLWIYNKDLGRHDINCDLARAAAHMNQHSYSEGGPLYIHFMNFLTKDSIRVNDEFNGLQFNLAIYGKTEPWGPWQPGIPYNQGQKPWFYPEPKAAKVDGVQCRITVPENPYIFLDLEDGVIEQESIIKSDNYGKIKKGWMKITFNDTNTSKIYVDYNWKGKDSYTKSAVISKSNSGKWVTAQVELSQLIFRTAREMPEPDFRIHSEDGNLAIEKVELRFKK